MTKKSRFTRAQIKNHIKNIQEAIEKQRRDHEQKGKRVVSITPEEIEKKLKRINSPFITYIITSGHALNPGGTFYYGFGIYNPDATQVFELCGHIWVGSGNIDPTVGTFLLNVDTRFPRLTQVIVQLDPNTSGYVDFNFQVPVTIERTIYFLQSCLMEINPFNTGRYLDRGAILLNVV
jgi:hypothetical protein